MHAIERAIARARRRLLATRWLTFIGWSLLLGCIAAGIVLALERTSLVVVPWELYVAAAGAAVVLASGASFTKRPTDSSVAALVDDKLKLKDRLGTALWAREISDDPFAQHVLEEAEQAALAVDSSEALKLRSGNGWKWALPAWSVWALLFVFLPLFDPLGAGEQREAEAIAKTQETIASENILEASTLVRNLDKELSELSEGDPSDPLKNLMDLSKRDLRNPEMRSKTVAELSEAQDQLAKAYDAKQQQQRALQNQMSTLDAGQSGPADRFADAMRRGDFEQARKELEAIEKKIEQSDYSEAEKEALKQQLANMSQQLQQMAQNAAAQQQQTQQQINQQLQQAGVSQQQAQQLQQNGYNQQQVQQALQQAYQKQGMTQQQAQQKAQQQAQQISQQQQQSQSQNASQSQCNSLSQSLGQMASSMGQQGQGQQGQGQQGQGQQGQGSSQFGPSSSMAQQQLAQMAQMQQQMQQMQQAQQQMQQAMQAMNNSQCKGGNCSGGHPGQCMGGGKPGKGAGTGGRQAGTGRGGPPLGAETNLTGQYQTRSEGDIKERQGRVIASWQSFGEVAAGEPTVAYNNAVTEARTEAERAVTDDRVPRKYHGAVKGYFDQMPQSPDEVKATPSAPR